MRTSTYKLLANERLEIAASGNYIRVRQSAVDLIIENGQSNEIVEVSQGDDFEFSDFKNLYITNTSAAEQIIKLTIARNKKAGSAKVGGSVTVAGDINLSAATLAALESVDLNAATLAALESVDLNAATRDLLRFETYGSSYRSTLNLAANTAETVFTAAANVNGAIIHSAQFLSINNASNSSEGAAFLAKATAPASNVDGDGILSADTYGSNGATINVQNGSLKNPIRIPAGKGLFFITSIAQITTSRSVLYTLL